MRVVMKFGGVSVKDGKNVLHCANLVKKFAKDNEIVVVVSAMSGVTDSLVNAAYKCCYERSLGFIKSFIADLTKKHYEAVEVAVKNKSIKSKVLSTIDNLIDELEKVLTGIATWESLRRGVKITSYPSARGCLLRYSPPLCSL